MTTYRYFCKITEPNSWFSQWSSYPIIEAPLPADLVLPAIPIPLGTIFPTAEHRMMYGKAILFGDDEKAAEILHAQTPKDVKSLGRQVSGFDQAAWNATCDKLVEASNYLKFTQSIELRNRILATGTDTLVEAASYDRVWGIGYSAANAYANRNNWGENRLGKALMKVRNRIQNE
jgi:ribA/ribD-fused uncharacterized protein